MKSINKYDNDMICSQPLWFIPSLLFYSSSTVVSEIKTANYPLPEDDTEVFSGDSPENLTNVNGTIFFTTEKGSLLYKFDETSYSPSMVKSFDFDAESNSVESIATLINVNGTLYFVVDGWDGHDYSWSHLWKTDGTPQGTVQVMGTSGDTTGHTVVGSTLFFASTDSYDPSLEFWDVKSWLWKSDGTEAGSLKIMNLENDPTSNDYAFISHGGSDPRLSFFETDRETGDLDFWSIKEIAAGAPAIVQTVDDLTINKAVELNGEVIIFVTNDSGQLQLLKFCDDCVCAEHVKDIPDGSLSKATVVNGTLFFTISDDETDTESLWKSDGKKEGTVLIRNFDEISISNMTNVNGTLHFSSKGGNIGNAVWRINGAKEGKIVIQNINSPIVNIIDVVGELIFTTMDKVSDGSEDMYAKNLYRYSTEEGVTNIFSSVDSFRGPFEYEVVDSTGTLFFKLSKNKIHKYEAACD